MTDSFAVYIAQSSLKGYDLCVYLSHPKFSRYPACWTNDPEVARRFRDKVLNNLTQVFGLYQLTNDRDSYIKLEKLMEEIENEVENELAKEDEEGRIIQANWED